ncbi:MAG TPA: hypothetical protein VFG87_18980 [Amycolatopsis sp.]|nr:hypothetical protein [Amycolatopsis sp.]
MTRHTPQNVPASPSAAPAPDLPTEPDLDAVPRLAEGISLLGEYEGGGYDEPRYLVSRDDGQMVLVSRMLNAVLGAITGDRTLAQVAEQASRDFGALLSPEAAQYLIERKLKPLGLATLDEQVAAPPRANPLLALSLHRVLIPAGAVRRLAAMFAPLFLPPIVVAVLLALLTLDVWLLVTGHVDTSLHASVGSPGLMLAVFGVMITNTLFHECGHAGGCHYGGGRPGAIGVGVLIVAPAFYTNVNDAYRLDRRGRLRTDLGGIYFNSVFAVMLGAIYLTTGFAAIPTIIVLIHVQMLQQLIPLVRLDGYYILGDLVGVPNLFEQIPPILRHAVLRREPARSIRNLRRRVRVIITIWVALVVPALLAAMVNMVIFLPRYLDTAMVNIAQYWHVCTVAFDRGEAGVVTLAVLSMIILLVPWVGVTSLVTRLVLKILRGVRERVRRARVGAGHSGEIGQREQELAEYQR